MVRFRFVGLFALAGGSFVAAGVFVQAYVSGSEAALETDQQLCTASGTDGNACAVACGQGYLACGSLGAENSCYNPDIGETCCPDSSVCAFLQSCSPLGDGCCGIGTQNLTCGTSGDPLSGGSHISIQIDQSTTITRGGPEGESVALSLSGTQLVLVGTSTEPMNTGATTGSSTKGQATSAPEGVSTGSNTVSTSTATDPKISTSTPTPNQTNAAYPRAVPDFLGMLLLYCFVTSFDFSSLFLFHL